MSFEWSSNDNVKKTVTIVNNTITLNTAACVHFQNVQYVLLGIDKEKRLLGIKPITKEQVDSNIYPFEQLHRISIGKSYGRITNKSFIEELSMKCDVMYSDYTDRTQQLVF